MVLTLTVSEWVLSLGNSVSIFRSVSLMSVSLGQYLMSVSLGLLVPVSQISKRKTASVFLFEGYKLLETF